jgi:hypothetical protein
MKSRILAAEPVGLRDFAPHRMRHEYQAGPQFRCHRGKGSPVDSPFLFNIEEGAGKPLRERDVLRREPLIRPEKNVTMFRFQNARIPGPVRVEFPTDKTPATGWVPGLHILRPPGCRPGTWADRRDLRRLASYFACPQIVSYGSAPPAGADSSSRRSGLRGHIPPIQWSCSLNFDEVDVGSW